MDYLKNNTVYRKIILLIVVLPGFLLSACSAKESVDNEPAITKAETTLDASQTAPAVKVNKPVLDAGYLALLEKSRENVAQALANNPKNFRAGQHYDELPARQSTASGSDTIEVAEFFSYGCPACFNAEPSMHAYGAQLPEDVRFVRVPVSFNSLFENFARGYYAANALGVSEDAHVALFDALHVKRQNLSSEKALANFYSQFGVDREKFLKSLHSFSVNSMIERDKKLALNYQVGSVPTVIVNGKYNTGGKKAGTMEVWLQVLDTLVEKERLQMK